MRLLVLFPLVFALGGSILSSLPGAHADTRHFSGAGQEGAIEIEKCQTISQPGSYELVDNLIFNGPAGGTCLSITASFVTIDLAGFTITSNVDNPTSETAIAAPDDTTTGITVRNGSISGSFRTRVSLAGDGSIVEGLRVSGVSGLGGTGISAKGIIRNNTVIGIAGSGPGNGVGINATGVITGNYSSNNRIGIVAGVGSTVIGNTVMNSSEEGIFANCPSNVTDNTVTGNGPLVLPTPPSGSGCNDTNNVAPP